MALRFAAAGAEVVIGSRSLERAEAAASAYNEILGVSLISGATNGEMLRRSEIVFLTLPFDKAVSAVEACRTDFEAGTIVVDVTVPMVFRAGAPEFVVPACGSNSAKIAEALPHGVELVAAFKTIPAHVLADKNLPLDCDVFVCGGSIEARERVVEAARQIPTLRPLDAGPLSNAGTLERMTVLAVQLNRRYKSKGARFRITGIYA